MNKIYICQLMYIEYVLYREKQFIKLIFKVQPFNQTLVFDH